MSLISIESLAARIGDPSLRIVDVRWYLGRPGAGRAAYAAGHLPDATFVDMDSDLVAPSGAGRHPLPDPATFATRMGALGIGDEHDVVVYDDVGGWVAARLWWMLDDLGHRSVAVLDGGFQAWTGGGHPVSDTAPSFAVARLSVAGRWTHVVDRDEVRSRLGHVVLLDARGAPRYRGEIEPIDPVAGHIPTALNAPTDGNLAADGRFLPADELEARFVALGVPRGGSGAAMDVVTSCGSGVSACHNALAMRIAGLPDPILYPGSWSDWGTAGYPVAIGPEPGEPPGS